MEITKLNTCKKFKMRIYSKFKQEAYSPISSVLSFALQGFQKEKERINGHRTYLKKQQLKASLICGRTVSFRSREHKESQNKMNPKKSTPSTSKLKWQNLKGKSNSAKKATGYVKYICIHVHICALNTCTHVYTGYVKCTHTHTHTTSIRI